MCLFVYLRNACASDLMFFFFQAEDGIRDLVRSRGLGDVYKRQACQFGFTVVSIDRRAKFHDHSCDARILSRPAGVALSLIHI